MKVQWEYDLVEKPFCQQLQKMDWQWLEGDTDVSELRRGTFREVILTGRGRKNSDARPGTSTGAAERWRRASDDSSLADDSSNSHEGHCVPARLRARLTKRLKVQGSRFTACCFP